MKPNPDYITIDDNESKIVIMLDELVLTPRLKALEWSKLTKQTPNMKVGYPGQHLASLITGVEGARTGARGDDLVDGTEVKSCSRVDQLDTCKSCNNKVLRIETICPHCNSDDIKRMNDSKWLFAIKNQNELQLLTQGVDRILLTIADYPNFEDNNFENIRFQAFEIWNNNDRHTYFTRLMTNYYNKIFLEHISRNPNKTPAPKNFWPYSFQFYLCNPIRVFSCFVSEANSNPEIKIEYYVDPYQDRSSLQPEPMPTSLLTIEEWGTLIEKAQEYGLAPQIVEGKTFQDVLINRNNRTELTSILPFINENTRGYLELRDTDKVTEAKVPYIRRQ